MGAEREKTSAFRLIEKLKHNRFLLAAMLIGILIMLFAPSGSSETDKSGVLAEGANTLEYSLRDEELRLERLLSQVDGAGDVAVMLSLKAGAERVLAEDLETDEAYSDDKSDRQESRRIVLTGSRSDGDALTVQYIYPEYQGAVVVAEGAGNADIRLKLTKAVMAVTGLGADRISIVKMEEKG